MNETQFGTLPVKKIFFKLALPGMISMLFMSISMMVDGIFVGQFIGGQALAAVNLIMPVFMILFAVGDMIAVGSSVKIAIKLGEGDPKKASQLFSASLLIILFFSSIIAILGAIFAEDLIFMMIADVELAQMAFDYSRVFIYSAPLIFPFFALDNYLRICGKANLSMYISLGAAILNVALDAFLIGYLGLGIASAAFATAFGMVMGCLVAAFTFLFGKCTLKFTKPKMSLLDLRGIVYNGSSEFLNNISGSLMAIVVNALLLHFGGFVAVSAYAVVQYIDGTLIALLYGMQDSVQPAVSYNLGLGKPQRILQLFHLCTITGIALSATALVLMFAFPDFLISIFSQKTDVAVIEMARTALFYYAPSHIFTWFIMLTSSFLTSFDKPAESVRIMLARSLVFPLLSLVVMTPLFGIIGVFVTPTISGSFTFVVAYVLWRKVKKEFV